MKECKYCRSMYDEELTACPNCGGNKIITAREKAEETEFEKREIENHEQSIAAPKIRQMRAIGILFAVVTIVLIIIGISSYNANKPLSNGMSQDEGDTLLEQGINYYNAGNYEAAIDCFLQLPTDSEQYEEAKELLEKTSQEYKNDVITKVNSYKDKSEYKTALKMLENAKAILSDDSDINDLYNKINAEYKQSVSTKAISDANECASKDDLEGAIKILNQAKDEIGDEPEVVALLETYTDEFVKNVFAEANGVYKPYDINALNAATATISKALTVLPDNNKLQKELAKYEDLQPVSLMDMATDNQSLHGYSYKYEYAGEKQDSLGNTYITTLVPSDWAESSHPYGWDGGPWAKAQWAWILDYQYSRVTGIFAFDGHYKSSPVEIELTVTKSANEDWDYDSQKIYKLTSSSGFLKFDFDLTGAKSVEFDVEQNEKGGTYLFLADVYFWE